MGFNIDRYILIILAALVLGLALGILVMLPDLLIDRLGQWFGDGINADLGKG